MACARSGVSFAVRAATWLDARWNVADFRSDEARVVAFQRDGYRAARAPSLEDARRDLGEELTERFIEGSARALLDHSFTSDLTKLYMAMTVIESGPVSLDAPLSAFNVPVLCQNSALLK